MIPPATTLTVRQTLFTWLINICHAGINLPPYIENNIAAVIARLIKLDFPQDWPEAFADVLSLTRYGVQGLTIALRIIFELDVEVVMFDERRTEEEIRHNTLIKDTMRERSIIKDIVDLLCRSLTTYRKVDYRLARQCLRALGTMIGWIDISLVVNENMLGLLYDCLLDQRISAAACNCLYEVVKKGMDPTSKVAMVHSMRLLSVLRQVPVVGLTGGNAPEDDDEDSYDSVLASLIDLLFQEVVVCWTNYEEHIMKITPPNVRSSPSSKNKSMDSQQSVTDQNVLALLEANGLIAGAMLNECVPMLLALLTIQDSAVYVSVIPSLSKLLSTFKLQSNYEGPLQALAASAGPTLPPDKAFFLASRFISQKPDMLMSIYKAMQYPSEFGYDLDDEDDCEEIEVSACIVPG